VNKTVSIILIVLILASLEFYNTLKKNVNNFALCGTSYEETQPDNNSGSEFIGNYANIELKNPLKMQLKEITNEISVPINYYWINVHIQRSHSTSYLVLMEEIKVDNLFLSSIFKPPKA